MSNTTAAQPVELPHPDKVRERLLELSSEARILRKLLPLSERAHGRDRRPGLACSNSEGAKA